MIFCERYEKNEIVNKLFHEGVNCVPQMHLRELEFTYRDCGQFIKSKNNY